MKKWIVVVTLFAGLLLSCEDNNPTSSAQVIKVYGSVIPNTAKAIFVMGKDTTEINVDSDGTFSVKINPGKGTFIFTDSGYREYKTSPSYSFGGTYDLGTIKLGKKPFPLSGIYKSFNYNVGSRLYYIDFSEEMDTLSVSAVTTSPEINGTFEWENNNKRLNFYPDFSFRDTVELTVKLDTTARTIYDNVLEFAYEEVFSLGDPKLKSIYPNPGTIDVSTNLTANIRFSEDMLDSNLSNAIKVSPSVPLQMRVSGNYIYISPESGSLWPNGKICTLSVVDTLYTKKGSPIVLDDVKWSFTIISGTISVNPSNRRENVDVSTKVNLSFALPVDKSSVEDAFVLKDSSGDTVSGSFEWNSRGTGLSFTPDDLLKHSASYTVIVSSSAKLENGTHMKALKSTFYTNQGSVNSVNPSNKRANVNVDTKITMYFTESVDKSSVEDAFALKDSSGDTISGSFEWNSKYTTVNFIPDDLLNNSATYAIAVGSSAKMLDGTSLKFFKSEFYTASLGVNNSTIYVTPIDSITGYSITGNVYVRVPSNSKYGVKQIKDALGVYDKNGTKLSGHFTTYSTYFYFYPKGMKYGEWYHILALVSDTASSDVDTLISSSFRTIPFSPTSVKPANQSVLSKSTDKIEITVNAEIDKYSIVSALSISPSIACNYYLSSNNKTVYIVPFSGAWKSLEEYTLTVNKSNFVNTGGASIENIDSVISFTAPAVKVIDHAPLNGLTNVDDSTTISLTFNTIMDTAKTNSAFLVKDTSGTQFSGTLSWNSDFTALTFTKPTTSKFVNGMNYTVSVDTNATDLYGVKMKDNFEVSFTVEK